MGFELISSPPSLRITRPDGRIVLDTAERPALITEYLTGRVSMPLRDTPVDVRTEIVLGSCEIGTSFTIAMIRFTTFPTGRPAILGKWLNMSGTFTDDLGNYTANASYIGRSVVIDGQSIKFIEQVHVPRIRPFPDSPQWLPVYPYRADYRIWAGRFHG